MTSDICVGDYVTPEHMFNCIGIVVEHYTKEQWANKSALYTDMPPRTGVYKIEWLLGPKLIDYNIYWWADMISKVEHNNKYLYSDKLFGIFS